MAAGLGQIDIRRAVLAGNQSTLDRYILYAIEKGLNHFDRVGNATGGPWPFVDGYMLFSLSGFSSKAHACVGCKSINRHTVDLQNSELSKLGENIQICFRHDP